MASFNFIFLLFLDFTLKTPELFFWLVTKRKTLGFKTVTPEEEVMGVKEDYLAKVSLK